MFVNVSKSDYQFQIWFHHNFYSHFIIIIFAPMGVNKLWDILLTIAVKKNIEDLSGLILAIDASLWIVKVNSIF